MSLYSIRARGFVLFFIGLRDVCSFRLLCSNKEFWIWRYRVILVRGCYSGWYVIFLKLIRLTNGFEVVLIIRTCALWGNNWKIKYFLLALFVSIFVPMAISVNLALDAFDCAFSNWSGECWCIWPFDRYAFPSAVDITRMFRHFCASVLC